MKLRILLILPLALNQNAPAYATESHNAAHKASNSVFDQGTRNSTGFGTDSARIDSQITLKIPEGKAQEVYEYLRQRYVHDRSFLDQNFAGLAVKAQKRVDISQFVDEYFDTPNMDLFQNQNSVRHRKRINTTDPSDRKSGRELVQVKVTPPGRFDVRTELKFKVDRSSSKKIRVPEFHPLVRLIDPELRADFRNALSSVGMNADDLRHVLTNRQVRSRIYMNLDGENFLSFSVDEFWARTLWARASAASVDVGLVENAFTGANSEKRKLMWAVRELMLKDLKERFPELSQNFEDKYVILMKQTMEKIPFTPFLVRWVWGVLN